MSRLRRGAVGGACVGLAALCVATVGNFEGLRLAAYIPVKGDVPTICYGETRGVRMGQRRTKAECDGMLVARLDEFADGVERCVTRPMRDETYAAFVSLAYNIGTGAFCRSSVVRYFNAGREMAACDNIMLFDKAGGRVLPGLIRRREAERALCLKGAA